MIYSLWRTFTELISTPFGHAELMWGIVPLYFGLVLNEITSTKASFRTAIQTGFSFLWAGAQWLYPYLKAHGHGVARLELGALLPVNLVVTFAVIALGFLAFVCGMVGRFPKYGSFLGHTRFANYFMIAIFPIQARVVGWTWERLLVIALFAAPVWLVLHYGLAPVRDAR